jgi:hypothetical protein
LRLYCGISQTLTRIRHQGESSSATALPATTAGTPFWLTSTFISFLSLSRVGATVFSLATQQLSQTLIPQHQTSPSAGLETSFMSMFEFFPYIVAITWSKPHQFKYLAVGSLAAVGISIVMYLIWLARDSGDRVGRLSLQKAAMISTERFRIDGFDSQSRFIAPFEGCD